MDINPTPAPNPTPPPNPVPNPVPKPAPLYILAINGGGARAMVSIAFLCKMTAHLKVLNPAFNLGTFFDIYAGSSAGAYMINYFLISQRSPEELKVYFRNNVAQIMKQSLADVIFGLYQTKPKYDGVDKYKFIKEFAGDHTFASYNPQKIVLVTAYDIKKGKMRVFNSTKVNKALLTRDILNASSAAPCYYPCAHVPNCQDLNERVTESWFLDGGLEANNPTLCALAAVPSADAGRQKIVINIGNGYKHRKIDCRLAVHYGTYQWFSAGMLTLPPEGFLVEQLAEQLLHAPNIYINIDGELPDNVPWSMDACSLIDLQHMSLYGEQLWELNKHKFDNFFFS